MNPLPINDFNQRYTATYIQYYNKDTKISEVAYVEGCDVDIEGHGMIHLMFANRQAHLRYPECWPELNLSIPDVGYFNINGFAVYVFRYAERQWRRGFCNGNTELYNPFKRIIAMDIYRPRLNMASANKIFNREFIRDCGRVAYDILNNKEVVSCALNQSLMFSKSPITDTKMLVWYNLNPVAQLEGDHTIVVKDETFKQELYDIVARENLWPQGLQWKF